MTRLFLSHSSQDDAFVRDLRAALALHGQDAWIDSRALRGGDPLWTEIRQAMEEASAYAVLVSRDAFESDWVSDELEYAIGLQKQRGREQFPVIPLLLDGVRLGAFKKLFPEEPIHLSLSSAPGGVEAAINAMLIALGKREPADVPVIPQPKAPPLEELVLELTDLQFPDQPDGNPPDHPRATARARLVYHPATSGQPAVQGTQPWRFTAPIGPLEAAELRWYLEDYANWPSGVPAVRDRARAVVENLARWGQLLYRAALPLEPTANVLRAWEKVPDQAGRRFSVRVDAAVEAGASDTETAAAQKAATTLLGLPWELLHDGGNNSSNNGAYLFQGANPTRVRRRLPNTRALAVPIAAPPIRILLITPRPEDEACQYIDHRASALPLVEAMETLPGLVNIHFLRPPTFSALREELDRARRADTPYHVVHFNGHGVYNPEIGLGGLCFEDPEDANKLEQRRHHTVTTEELGPLLRDYRIPLVFLEACQSASAHGASESVASALLKAGVASVVAMSHSVLVKTARRFVAAFYRALAAGQRVGEAMLAGQRALADDTRRGRVLGGEDLRLEDWFVPVLFQEEEDPQLFAAIPVRQTREDARAALAARLGDVPSAPETGFIGRSRELLALERLLHHAATGGPQHRYVAIRGQGGEGKTALAAEFARWQSRAHRARRCAFVSVEGMERNILESVLDKLGAQLIRRGFSTQADCQGDPEKATQAIQRQLREQSTLLIMDNMESLLPPPFLAGSASPVLAEEGRAELQTLLALCRRLLEAGETRCLFTSREALPAPFDARRNRLELHRLHRADAVKLVERVVNADGGEAIHFGGEASAKDQYVISDGLDVIQNNPDVISNDMDIISDDLDVLSVDNEVISDNPESIPFDQKVLPGRHDIMSSGPGAMSSGFQDAAPEEIEALVDAVHCHARTLALLAPALRTQGVRATRQSLEALMADMEARFPGNREQSLFAGVELSLQRLSPENQSRVSVLGLFRGGVQLDVLAMMMEWEKADVGSLARELVETGLATPNRYNHLTLHPALCPYLRLQPLPSSSRQGMPGPSARDGKHGKDKPLAPRWRATMLQYTAFLDQQQHRDAEMAATLTLLELPNLLALLDIVRSGGDPAAVIDLTTSLYSLLQALGKPRLLEHVGKARDAAEAELMEKSGEGSSDTWSHAMFEAARTRIEQQFGNGQLQKALEGAEQLLQRARTAGQEIDDQAYREADYDLATACWLLGRMLKETGNAGPALPLLEEARQRFEAIEKRRPGCGAERMATVCLAEQGGCLSDLGRLDEAATAYQKAIHRAEQRGAERDVAVGKGQLGAVRLEQRRYPEALAAYQEAREHFTRLDEPHTVAGIWHQTGMVYEEMGQPEAAEEAYRQSLAIFARLGDVGWQAGTLLQLGNLYKDALERPEQAVAFYRQAADKYLEMGDAAKEGKACSGLAIALRILRRPNEARQQIRRSIKCAESFGHEIEPWKFWAILAAIELEAGNPGAAAEARAKATDLYLVYRRAGGENHDADGRIALAVTEALTKGEATSAAALLEQLAAEPKAAWLLPFIRALQSILDGSRDPALAHAPDLSYGMAAEILFLLERLAASGP